MHQVTIEDASARLAELFAEAGRGEEVVIQGDGLAMRLIPVTPEKPQPRFGSARDMLVYMAPDFDATPEGFEDYL